MSSHRSNFWLPLTGTSLIVVVVIAVLGWLLLGFAGDRAGMTPLPDAAVEYFTDHGRRQTLAGMERLPPDAWRIWSGRDYLGARGGDALWLRVTLRNPSDKPLHGVLENADYFTDRADAWVWAENVRLHLLSGETVPAKEKALPGREVAWPVTVPARGEGGGQTVVYLRAENYFNLDVRLVWWPDAAAFHLARMHGSLAEGIYLGGLLALLAYNTLLWLRLRQADIGCYVLYLGMGAAFMFLARAQWPALGWAFGSPGLETALTVALALCGFFLTQFARVFLELKTTFPRTNRWILGWSLLLLVLIAGSFTTPWWRWWSWLKVVTLAIGVTHLGLLTLALAAWRAGVGQARFFVLSFGCLFAGSLPMVAVWFWESLLRDVAIRGLMIGSALEMLLLSLAVAERFARAQRQLVEETEQRRMIEEAYAGELAEEVRERTRELQAANIDKDRMLAVIGHDLRSPLTGLMRAADETTGEFARDAARTGRALLLLIEDLVLWARLRAGTHGTSAHQASALVAPAVALHHALAVQDGVELVLDVPESIRVETDLVLAQTLVRNLLANALKFADSRVVLRAEEIGEGVRFTVGNDGPALPAAVAARLAAGVDEPMTATDGMGLRLCREICQALGMRLEAKSGADGGTEFGFTLKWVTRATEANL